MINPEIKKMLINKIGKIEYNKISQQTKLILIKDIIMKGKGKENFDNMVLVEELFNIRKRNILHKKNYISIKDFKDWNEYNKYKKLFLKIRNTFKIGYTCPIKNKKKTTSIKISLSLKKRLYYLKNLNQTYDDFLIELIKKEIR